MKELNFIGTSPLSAPVKPMVLIDEAAMRITVVALMSLNAMGVEPEPGDEIVTWATAEPILLQHSAKMFYNRADVDVPFNSKINCVPDQEETDVFAVAWKCTLDIASLGADEWCDYTMINVTTRSGGSEFVGVRARLAESRIMKADGARYRAHGDYKHIVCLYVPFAKDNFDNVTMDIINRFEFPPYVVGGTVDTVTNENINPPTGHVWHTRFWDVQQSAAVTVAADGYVDIPLQLQWTANNAPCAEVTTLKIEPKSGYTCSTRVTTDTNGQGVCRVGALGLSPGDVVEMKVNSHLMQNLGTLTATVV